MKVAFKLLTHFLSEVKCESTELKHGNKNYGRVLGLGNKDYHQNLHYHNVNHYEIFVALGARQVKCYRFRHYFAEVPKRSFFLQCYIK